MSRNASTSNHTMRNKFGSTSTNGSSQVPTDQQLQTYIDHYRGKGVGKKRDFVNMPIDTYKSLGSIGHIMVDKPTKLSTDTTVIEFIVTNHHSQPYMRRGVSWRCIVDGTGYKFRRHA